ncbi:MAG: Fpg/Nei family DNA glycosylase [Cephaloticoccus sp.]|nr:Fpg/Nei family DNA glycosylase [Cephaloticoccus sp.]MCF7760012.1 Fpg/Nei family DNA glycosylase [Cephaloticoccus sp.]
MPELAEVEFYRQRWHQAACHRPVIAVHTHDGNKLFRHAPADKLRQAITGQRMKSSFTSAKQMLFRFGTDCWLGIHLGMSGELRVEAAHHQPARHDHLTLRTRFHTLVFSDPRMFGKIEFHQGKQAPGWWTRIAPAILSQEFTIEQVAAFLLRRARAPIKAVLLMQERFPGIGNWMADEILWRAGIHPRRLAGSLEAGEIRTLWRECRTVCRMALRTIAGQGGHLPPDLNVNIPDTWLFNHRWQDNGCCPRTRCRLVREIIAGRTTCWAPDRQKP